MKDKAMSAISPYLLSGDKTLSSKQVLDIGYEPFVSLLEFISEIYQVFLLFCLFNVSLSSYYI